MVQCLYHGALGRWVLYPSTVVLPLYCMAMQGLGVPIAPSQHAIAVQGSILYWGTDLLVSTHTAQ